MKNDSFDSSIRQKLTGHEAPVPADAWENIQKGKRKRRPLPFFWIFAGLLLCGGAGFFFYKNDQAGKKVIAAKRSPVQKGGLKNAVSADVPDNRKNDPATGKTSQEKNITQLSQQKNTGNTGNDLVKNSKTVEDKNQPTVQLFPQNDNNIIAFNKKRSAGSIIENKLAINDESAVDKPIAKRNQQRDDARLAMTITAPQTEDELSAVEEIKDDHLSNKDSILLKVKGEVAMSSEKKKKDTIQNIAATEVKKIKQNEVKKKKKTGLEIDLSISGIMPVQNQQKIVSVSRTMETALNKAVFTADKVNTRLRPSFGFNLMLFKNVSSKTAIGAGLSHTVIKEYIDLSGEEINTKYSVIQRLQNGNSLVNDTVMTVTKGTRNINAVNSYTFLSIPVAIRYQALNRNKWTLDLTAGIDINLQNRYKNSIGGVLVPQFPGANNTKRNQSIGTGFNAGLRLGRRINKNYLIYAAPYFQVNPKKLYLEEMLSPAAIQRAGISFGISYRL